MMPTKVLLLAHAALLLLLPSSTTVVVRGANQDAVADLSPAAEAAADAAVVAAEDAALMGKVFPLLSNLFARKGGGLSFRQVFRAVTDLVDERECVVLAAIGWGAAPVARSVYDIARARRAGAVEDDEGAGADADEGSVSKLREAYEYVAPWRNGSTNRMRRMWGSGEGAGSVGEGVVAVKRRREGTAPFEDTLAFQAADLIGQAARIGLSVIAVDVLSLIGRMMGYNPWNVMDKASKIYSKVVYTGLITLRLCALKRYFLGKAFGSDMGKMNVVDNLLNGVFYLVGMFSLLNYLEVYTGIAVKSLFSVGATGTLVFGLASKDIASQIIGSLTLHLSDKVFEGDDVRFSDGTSGKIERMGWFETMIRNSDELVVGIPNTQLSGQRVYNLSRTPRSQVKQELRISYDDAAKIPKFLEAIKEEIRKDCPKLIADGSRPFRAHWRNFEDDHLQVVVDCHFTIKPTGTEYYDNRQKMLEAIYRAAKRTDVHFERLARAVRV